MPRNPTVFSPSPELGSLPDGRKPNSFDIAGLILTGDSEPDERIIRFCRPAFQTGLPLLRVSTNSYDTATRLYQLSTAVPADDVQRIEDAIDHVALTLDIDWLISQSKKRPSPRPVWKIAGGPGGEERRNSRAS